MRMKTETIEETIGRHEGLRLKPYHCTAGKLTIGYGRNLEDKGLTVEESMYLLKNDVAESIQDLKVNFRWYEGLDHIRKSVMVNMRFNLGPARFRKFKNTLKALARGDYEAVAEGMKNSLWYRQVGNRAVELVEAMRLGNSSPA